MIKISELIVLTWDLRSTAAAAQSPVNQVGDNGSSPTCYRCDHLQKVLNKACKATKTTKTRVQDGATEEYQLLADQQVVTVLINAIIHRSLNVSDV